MNEKSEVSQIFQNFHSMIQTQFHTNIQILKTNNAKEYFNSKLNTYYLNQGILHISSCVDTPQQNGVAERKNRHLMSFQQASSHFCNQNTFNLSRLISLNFTCWSLIKKFCQNTHWNKHLMLSEQQRDNGKICFVKGWDVIPKQKCRMTKLHNKIIDKLTRFLDLAISVFCQTFSIICRFEDVLVTIWLMTSSLTNSTCLLLIHLRTWFLKFLQLFNWMAQNLRWYSNLLFRLYHLRNNGCMGFNGVRTTSLGPNRCW